MIDDLEANKNACLFDPQTSGGLLFGINQDQVEKVLKFLVQEGLEQTAVIGIVSEKTNQGIPVLQVD